jgi:hypothetical protein
VKERKSERIYSREEGRFFFVGRERDNGSKIQTEKLSSRFLGVLAGSKDPIVDGEQGKLKRPEA